MTETGLFFGSFNPIHIGHLVIANYILEYGKLNELWFVVSPHNPFKKKESLLDDHYRFDMVQMAIDKDDLRFRASDIEFRMQQPSYTIDTLTWLREKHPRHNFSIIMGADGLKGFHKWKNAELLVETTPRIIYPRPGFEEEDAFGLKNARVVDAPVIEISASFIREAIAEGRDIRYFLSSKVWAYIEKMGFYK